MRCLYSYRIRKRVILDPQKIYYNMYLAVFKVQSVWVLGYGLK